MAYGTTSEVARKGFVIISGDVTLETVLYVPIRDSLNWTNLLSCVTKFLPHVCEFKDLNLGRKIGNAKECAGLYLLIVENHKKRPIKIAHVSSSKDDVICFPLYLMFKCEVCELAKHTKSHYPIQPYKPSYPFSLIHLDIWGPSQVNNAGSKSFNPTFTSSELTMGRSTSIIRLYQTSCVNSPQHNGIADRKNRHLMDVTRSFMLSTNVPSHFGECLKKPLISIPHQTLLSIYLNPKLLTNLTPKIFECTSFVDDQKPNLSKLDPKVLKCIFFGYSVNRKGYKKLYHTMDVTFFDNQPFYPKSSIHGECEKTSEYQTWEIF
ncbi:hypothetical protein CR513_45512, partial [Mucuna pruriens]